jgi:hypothetical protein
MKSIVPINKLGKRMRPGAPSEGGFPGMSEQLEIVLLEDKLTLQKPGILYDTIAVESEKVSAPAWKKKYELREQDFAEFQEREYHSIGLHKPLGNLPSPNVAYIISSQDQVLFVQYRGYQECPCKCKKAEWDSFEFLLANVQTELM